MIKSAAKKAYLALIFLILYAPIFTLVILSFNNTKTRSRWTDLPASGISGFFRMRIL